MYYISWYIIYIYYKPTTVCHRTQDQECSWIPGKDENQKLKMLFGFYVSHLCSSLCISFIHFMYLCGRASSHSLIYVENEHSQLLG